VALFPLALLLVERRFYSDARRGAILGILLSLMVWLELRMAILAVMILVVVAVVQEVTSPSGRWKVITGIASCSAVVITLNAFWLLPTVLAPPSSLYDAAIGSSSALMGSGRNFGTLINALALMPSNWQSSASLIYLFIPAAWIALNIKYAVFKQNGRALGYNAIIVMLIFLTKGTNLPGPTVNLWLLQNLPLFVSYRNPSKFAVFIPIFMAYVIVLGLNRMIPKLNRVQRVVLVLCFLVAAYAGCGFIITGLTREFKGDPMKYQNEPHMFYPMPHAATEDLKLLYASMNEQPSRTYLMLPRDERHRLLSSRVHEVKADEADKKTDTVGGTGELFSGRHKYLASRLQMTGASGVVLHSGSTPEWNYSKQLGYSRALQAMLNARDMTPFRENRKIGKLGPQSVSGGVITAEVEQIERSSDPTTYAPRSLVLQIQHPISETVDIEVYGKNRNTPISSIFRTLSFPQAGEFIVVDWPQGEDHAFIKISGAIRPESLRLAQGFVTEQINNFYVAGTLTRSISDLRRSVTAGRSIGATYNAVSSQATATLPANTVSLNVNKQMVVDGSLRIGLLSSTADTVTYSIDGEKQEIATGQAVLEPNREHIFDIQVGKGMIKELTLSNIAQASELKLTTLSATQLGIAAPRDNEVFRIGSAVYIPPETTKCEAFDSLDLSKVVIIDHPGKGIHTIKCYKGEAVPPPPSPTGGGTISSVNVAPHVRRVSVDRVGVSDAYLFFNADYAIHWRAEVGNTILKHVSANYGKNAWAVDMLELCKKERTSCSQNDDGTYKLTFELRFFPQKLLFIGATISLLLGVVTALLIWITRKRVVMQ
jgi:hypothetical protein